MRLKDVESFMELRLKEFEFGHTKGHNGGSDRGIIYRLLEGE